MYLLNSNGQPEEVSDTCRISNSPALSYVFSYNTGLDETKSLEWVASDIGYYDYLGTTYPYLELTLS